MIGRSTHPRSHSAGALLAFAAALVAGCGGSAKHTATSASAPRSTPAPASTSAAPAAACRAGELTPAETEGPYYKQGAPERERLSAAGSPGRQLILTGLVRARDCRPVAHALLQFWQADANGQYDNTGFRLRGHEYTDASGRYRVQTVIPGRYPGRTPHIHVKVRPPAGPELTTQLYFPDQPSNRNDPIFDPRLLLPLKRTGTTYSAQFDFVVKT